MTKTVHLFLYSPVSIVVLGDTKVIKDSLKGIGGSFNPRLTHPLTKERVPGWVFSSKREQLIKDVCQSGVRDKLINEVKSHMSANISEARPAVICVDPGEVASDKFCETHKI